MSALTAPAGALRRLGWDSDWQEALDKITEERGHDLEPARVAVSERFNFLVLSEAGEEVARLTGPLRKLARRGERPVSGDWVALRRLGDEALIEAVLPRRTTFSRTRPERGGEQVLAANADYVFLVMSLLEDLNLSRLERYLTAADASGARPVVVLTKADLGDATARLQELQGVVGDVPVAAVSSKSGEGLEALSVYLDEGVTAALLGSSGAGKSTLVNRLAALQGDEALKTKDVDRLGRGRHTTSRRQLVLAPTGGLLLDTPGLRELALWEPDEALAASSASFADLEELAAVCRFSDCSHRVEPGCAVRGALEAGDIDERRLSSWLKLQGRQG